MLKIPLKILLVFQISGIDLPTLPPSKKFCLDDEESDEEIDEGGIFPQNRKSNKERDLAKICFQPYVKKKVF